MKALIIYHANCMDGFGAAWVAYNELKQVWKLGAGTTLLYDSIELYPANYGDIPPMDKIGLNTAVYILDFSYPAGVIGDMCTVAHTVTLIDHHKSAVEKLMDLAANPPMNLSIKLDTTKSGAMLTWEHFNLVGEPPRLIQHIQDRDLWKFELPYTKDIHANLSTYPHDIATWDKISEELENEQCFHEFIIEGAAILRYFDQQLKQVLESTKQPIEINGIKGLAANCNYLFASEAGNQLAKESGTFGCTWYQTPGGKIKMSLRSIGDFDVSEMAKKFGGGGHKNAAGFEITQFNGNTELILQSYEHSGFVEFYVQEIPTDGNG